MPYDEAEAFLSAVQEIPNEPILLETQNERTANQPKAWIMKAARSNGKTSHSSLTTRIANAWTSLLDLIKVECASSTEKHLLSP